MSAHTAETYFKRVAERFARGGRPTTSALHAAQEPPGRVTGSRPLDSGPMEAVFIALMALVVLLTGWVSIIVLWKLFKDDNGNDARRAVERASRI